MAFSLQSVATEDGLLERHREIQSGMGLVGK
jgi:hypothetical protein